MRGPYPGARFEDIPMTSALSAGRSFVAAWRQLAQDALDYVERLNPELAGG